MTPLTLSNPPPLPSAYQGPAPRERSDHPTTNNLSDLPTHTTTLWFPWTTATWILRKTPEAQRLRSPTREGRVTPPTTTSPITHHPLPSNSRPPRQQHSRRDERTESDGWENARGRVTTPSPPPRPCVTTHSPPPRSCMQTRGPRASTSTSPKRGWSRMARRPRWKQRGGLQRCGPTLLRANPRGKHHQPTCYLHLHHLPRHPLRRRDSGVTWHHPPMGTNTGTSLPPPSALQ